MNITYYQAIRNDENVATKGDIIKVDWDRDLDGTPAENLTRGTMYCPFRINNGTNNIMQELSANEALSILNVQYLESLTPKEYYDYMQEYQIAPDASGTSGL